jgi:hypothetical protein
MFPEARIGATRRIVVSPSGRDQMANTRTVEIHVQKIRHKITGQIGKVDLTYDRVTGRYFDGHGTAAPIINDRKALASGETVEF